MKINTKNGFDIRFIKNNTYALLVTFKDIEEDLRSAFFTVKENPEDTTPVLQKALGTGIVKVDDRAYKNEKKYKVQIQAEDTSFLEADVQYLYDLQVTVGNVVKTVISGLFVVSPTITGDKAIATAGDITAEVTDELEAELETTPATVGVEYESDPVALAKIGDLTNLETDNKTSVVNAVNEVKTQVRAEETARAEAITAEAEARTNAVNSEAMQRAEAVTAEETARKNADYALDERVSNLENGTTPIGKTTRAEKLETTGKLAGISTTLEHNVKQQFPSNILSISTNPLGGLNTFNSKGDKLTEAGIYLVRGYEKMPTGAVVYISTMLLIWDGLHPAVSSVGFLPNQSLTTAKTIYLAVLDTNGTLGCYQCNDEVPLEANSIIDDYDLTFRLYKIGETTLFEIDN